MGAEKRTISQAFCLLKIIEIFLYTLISSGGLPQAKPFHPNRRNLMPKKLFPTDLLDQAQAVLDAWNRFEPGRDLW